ncbi:MAG: Hsp20/alpha crystallin family protein [bacterium]
MTTLLEKRKNGFQPLSLILDDFFYDPVNERSDYYFKENENGVMYKFLMPEFNKKDIKITIEDGHLLINAENKENVFKNKTVQKIKLYKDFDVNKTKVKLENGVLTIDLFYSEKQKPKYIEIE